MNFSAIQHCSVTGIALQTTKHFVSASKRFFPVKHWVFSLEPKNAYKLFFEAKTDEEKFILALFPLVHLGKTTGTNHKDFSTGSINRMFTIAKNVTKEMKDISFEKREEIFKSVPGINLSTGNLKDTMNALELALDVLKVSNGEASNKSLYNVAINTSKGFEDVFNNSFYVASDLESKKDIFNDLWNEYPYQFPQGYEPCLYQFTCEGDSIDIDIINHLVTTCAELLDFTGSKAAANLAFYRFLQKRQNLALAAQDLAFGGMLTRREYKKHGVEGVTLTVIDTTQVFEDLSEEASKAADSLEFKTIGNERASLMAAKLKEALKAARDKREAKR